MRKNEPENNKEERLMILEKWIEMESGEGGDRDVKETVVKKLPKRVKKRRMLKVVNAESGKEVNEDAGWEEYYDLVFPDDEEKSKNLKILEFAHKWKEMNK